VNNNVTCVSLKELQCQQIIKLRNEGRLNREIANMLDLPMWRVSNIVSVLLVEGKLQKRKKGNQNNPACWRDIKDERTQTIINAMRERRSTLQEIGKVLGVTGERVSKLIAKIAQTHGIKVFEPQEQLWTVAQAARELGVSAHAIHGMGTRGDVSFHRRSKGSTPALINKAGMDVIRQRLSLICTVCGKQFIYKLGQGSRKACLDASCLKELGRRKGFVQKEPSAESLRGWRKDLWEILQNRQILKDEKWVPISEAVLRSGLTKMQIIWLQKRRVVRVCTDPKKKWRGQPIKLYGASEMDIARQVKATKGRT
jgi:hypothetical protein